ncbi:MAG: hypothetical protein JNJ57_04620, partial [Saprospiraceae bacterium]|nr:hypothetical protein [Saprospiraceae bacterium]
LISDNGVPNIHRLQNLMFTLFFGVYFWSEVINDLTIPSFDNNLLFLMGVSGVTYIAGKSMGGGNNPAS